MQKKRNGPWLRSLCSIFFSLLLAFLPGEYAWAETQSETAGQETEMCIRDRNMNAGGIPPGVSPWFFLRLLTLHFLETIIKKLK